MSVFRLLLTRVCRDHFTMFELTGAGRRCLGILNRKSHRWISHNLQTKGVIGGLSPAFDFSIGGAPYCEGSHMGEVLSAPIGSLQAMQGDLGDLFNTASSLSSPLGSSQPVHADWALTEELERLARIRTTPVTMADLQKQLSLTGEKKRCSFGRVVTQRNAFAVCASFVGFPSMFAIQCIH